MHTTLVCKCHRPQEAIVQLACIMVSLWISSTCLLTPWSPTKLWISGWSKPEECLMLLGKNCRETWKKEHFFSRKLGVFNVILLGTRNCILTNVYKCNSDTLCSSTWGDNLSNRSHTKLIDKRNSIDHLQWVWSWRVVVAMLVHTNVLRWLKESVFSHRCARMQAATLTSLAYMTLHVYMQTIYMLQICKLRWNRYLHSRTALWKSFLSTTAIH